MRTAGILMHLSSLPSPYGIGTMGKSARDFVDFLAKGGQSIWQVLPLGQTGYGDSPYQSFSSFAGNPYFIDLDQLEQEGLLLGEEYRELDWGDEDNRVDYSRMYALRYPVLRLACARLWADHRAEVTTYCNENRTWLEDYALFMALKERHGGVCWQEWPRGERLREPKALNQARIELAQEITFWQGVQYLFHRQWQALKKYANGKGISIFGDLPIYAAADSCDVWANPEQFQLDGEGHPVEVAGCPPDGFSQDGQLWGNPLFDWSHMQAERYRWWLERIAFQFQLFDMLRIDHFRGFEAYYAIPYGASTARKGRWRPGPGLDFFQTIFARLGERPIVAEDLGFLTPSVKKLLQDTGFPGMKVLQFAFDSREKGNDYLPHTYPTHCVAYTGTHDNDTVQGWMTSAPRKDVAFAREYLRLSKREGYHWGMVRSIWASPADLAIVPMQDILGLDGRARMNTPSTLGGNWQWRCLPGDCSVSLQRRLHREMKVYQRLPGQNDLEK
ncbi:MAG: 4-alpha-glucanotransferase [Lawsonibacter sp.]|jgi:4-alpha-glucanotransferase